MPDVSPETLDGLGFPVPPSPALLALDDMSRSADPAASAPVQLPMMQPLQPSKAALPLGAKNWGVRSNADSGTFAHHHLILQPSQPPTCPSASAFRQELAAAWRGARILLDICAGSERPFSAAVLAKGGSVLSVDMLLDASMNLLCNSFYEQLLHICGSGIIG